MGCIKFISQKKKSVESAISFIQCFIWVSDLERAETDPTKIADTETLRVVGGWFVWWSVCGLTKTLSTLPIRALKIKSKLNGSF